VNLGHAISSEEHRPLDIVGHARRAEEAGFQFALVSDHFHPWIDRQGQNPFVKGPLSHELALPSYFEEAAEMVDEDAISALDPAREQALGA
jgi:alkanesulfonate monooxygenase SsuD/methylene tetrahydromethanopterin reductase-like flavin-dependent oxidoreductase (luciferase family)